MDSSPAISAPARDRPAPVAHGDAPPADRTAAPGPSPGLSDDDILERLSRDGHVKDTDIARARRVAEEDAASVLAVLSRLGMVSERDLAECLAGALGLVLVPAEQYPAVPPRAEDVPVRFLRHQRVVPVDDDGSSVRLAMADPRDDYPCRALALATGRRVQPVVGLPSEIDAVLTRWYASDGESHGTGGDIATLAEAIDGGDGDEDVEQLKDLASEAPVIRVVNVILQRAVEAGASDVHIEPQESRLRVRLRIDGVLHDIDAPPARSRAAVISRVKIMARLNIAERRLPQDGRLLLRVQGRELDIRVSTVPTMHGESVVLRLLDRDSVNFAFTSLGFDGQPREALERCLARPHGVIIVTGPTGSGKTTTLYTALSRINLPGRKIITVEDPVEYQLEGINQIPVKPDIGLGFASALRSIVRQDPDVIMIGEIRDLETAQIAVQSALTGHLVLSTLHTNDAAGGITRLLDMGVPEYLLTSTISGIVAQRLVRRLCEQCRQAVSASPEEIADLHLPVGAHATPPTLHRAVGCTACAGTGYRGRLAIAECLVPGEEIRRLVLTRADATRIAAQTRELGMITMLDDGIGKALAGLTTVEEVLRVTQEQS